MEGGESLLDTLFDEENDDYGQDIEMLDVEEGELICQSSKTEVGGSFNGVADHRNEESSNRNSKRTKKKKKKKKKKKGKNRREGDSGDASINNTNRFVSDACKCLRERKSYLVWAAVGCLGVSALSDLLKEVDAIQSCGGQKTADGYRFRNGGGILWNIIKVREPNAYKEIMRKGKEYEKQFKQEANAKQEPRSRSEASAQNMTPDETSSQNITLDACHARSNPSDCLKMTSKDIELEISSAREKRASVHDRIRVPVTYDDLLRSDDSKDELA